MRTSVVLVALLCAVLVDAFAARSLPHNPSNDPNASIDALAEMSEAEQHSDWSSDEGTLDQMIERLQWFETLISVDIKLVGWESKESSGRFQIMEHDLFKYIESLRNDRQVHVVHPPKGHSHGLPVRTRFLYQVVKSNPELTDALRSKLRAETGKGVTDLPYTVVDDIIKEDFEKSPLSYTIYLMNLMPEYEGSMEKMYRYEVPASESASAASGSAPCKFSMYAGNERYMWIDLTAGPVTYGPNTSGEGLVTPYSIPRASNFHRPDEFIADLVSLLRQTSDLLIGPAIDHFPVPFVESVNVHLIIITDQLHGGEDEDTYETKLDHQLLDAQVKSLQLKGQTVGLGRSVISFHECELCVLAFTHALKSHTSNVISNGLRTQVHQYLDAVELHDWLMRFGREFWDLSLLTDEERIIPVFVFDLAMKDILLLDRFHQSVSFPELVIAVQTQASRALVDYKCNDQSRSIDTRDATRPVLASILQTGWGVMPTTQTFNPYTNATADNFLWGASQTPFGFFSESREISFPQRDAAMRNVLYSMVNSTLVDVRSLMQHFAQYELEMDEVMSPRAHRQFVRRWNIFRFKLDKAATYITVHNFNHALYYLRSSKHDVDALHELVHLAGQHLQTYTTCAKEQVSHGPGIISTLLFLAALAAGGYWAYERFVTSVSSKNKFA